jgi:hypothetical protein
MTAEPQRSELTVSSEVVMVIGLGMSFLGLFTKMYWWQLGGFMLFYLGVMTLNAKATPPSTTAPHEHHKLTADEFVALSLFLYAIIIGIVLLYQRDVTTFAVGAVLSYAALYLTWLGVRRMRVRGWCAQGELPDDRTSPGRP